LRGKAQTAFVGSTEGVRARLLRLLGIGLMLAALALLVRGAGEAQAKDAYASGGDLPGSFSKPTRVAVDDASGDVLVADNGQQKVQVWGPGGATAAELTSFRLSAPFGVAVDQSNGDIYVSNSARNEVQFFTIAGADSGTYALSFDGQTTAPISFDADGATIQAALEGLPNVAPGDVQVDGSSSGGTIAFIGTYARTDVPQVGADGSGLHDDPIAGPASASTETIAIAGVDEIARFRPDNRANPTVYTRDPTFVSPSGGRDPSAGEIGNFASPLAVDSVTGDLLVGDFGSNHVLRFDSSGSYVDSFDGSTSSGGAFQNILDLTVGDGVTYVVDSTGPREQPFTGYPDGTSRVEKFASDGASLGALPNDAGMDRARAIAYGKASGSVFVVQQTEGNPPGRVHVYRNGVEYQVVDYEFNGNFYAAAPGIAADEGSPSSSGRLYGALAPSALGGTPGVRVLDRHWLPEVTLDPASSVGTRSAHLSGNVDPVSGTAQSHFEYSADGGQNWISIATTEDTVSTPAIGHPQADLTGLLPSSSYRFRLVADNGDSLGAVTSSALTFTTLGEAPSVEAEQATERGASSATLRAKIAPLGIPSTYHFEYGRTAAYGYRVPALGERTAGAGQAPIAVEQLVQGLQPGTPYHFRVVAQNAAGVTLGSDHAFTTPTTNAEVRTYELVSPAAKGGNNVRSQVGMQASMDGEAFSYVSTVPFPGLSEAGPLYPRYVAQRGPDGWINRGTDPPQTGNQTGTGPIRLTFGVSDDGTKAVVMSLKKLAPGAVENEGNIYLRDVESGKYTTIATAPGTDWFGNEIYTQSYMFVQGTPDFSHVLLFANGTSFVPGVPPGALYDFTGGQLHVVSLDPAGNPMPGITKEYKRGTNVEDHGRNLISEDGERIAIWSPDGMYVRSNGITRPISASRRTSDPGTMQSGTLIGGDRELRHIYLFSKNLTDSSAPGEVSLYRYDTEDDSLHFLTKASDSPIAADIDVDLHYLQVSADGDAVYFGSKAALTPDATVTGGPNLYVWRDGTLTLVAALDYTYDHGGPAGAQFWWASPSGRYFAMSLATMVDDYDPVNPACSNGGVGDNGACHQIYLFDSETENLTCVSCPPDGHKASVSAYLMQTIADVGTHSFVRAVNDAGHVFFGSVEPLVDGDTNGTWDVYEYNGEQVGLISTGHGSGALLGEVSEDGRDVFFTTQDRLVAADTDDSNDVYDARLGGGIPSQNERPPTTTCAGEDCNSRASAGLALTPTGSEVSTGPESTSVRRVRQRCGKDQRVRKVNGRKRCVKPQRKKRQNQSRRQGR
jgi:hypothetical protein